MNIEKEFFVFCITIFPEETQIKKSKSGSKQIFITDERT